MLSGIEPHRTGRAVAENETFTEAVRIIAPEKLPEDRINQFTVRERAVEFHSILGRFKERKSSFEAKGIEFGGRVLLFGPPGTDFQSFVHHLATEVPLTLVTFALEQAIANPANAANTIKHSLEFARRNSPCLIQINRIELLSSAGAHISATLKTEIERTSWDNDEVIIVGSTAQPTQVDQELLSIFNRTFLFEPATTNDRTNCIERILKGWDGIELSILVEMTKGWSFADVKHMAVNLLMQDSETMRQVSKDQLQAWFESSGIHPAGNRRWVHGIASRIEGEQSPRLEDLEAEYPEGFLDQLYLMAVGDNYAETQRVIETLNSDLPLSSQDREFLARYPFLLTGNPEDRLTRLLRAKKSNDRLRRIMGR
jgi:SpoVK/Ycf46/Vps4 family AAA+-type ATPase